MSDVFISYAREDRSRVEGLVRLLEAQGFSVWWDRDIVPGESFDELIDKQIDQAAAVLVVWTKNSINSRWVRNEALEGMDRGILVPVLLDDVRIPVAFRQAQLANLVRWPRHSDETELRGLVEAIRSKVGRADADATYVSPPRGRLTITRLIAPIALVASVHRRGGRLPVQGEQHGQDDACSKSDRGDELCDGQPPAWRTDIGRVCIRAADLRADGFD